MQNTFNGGAKGGPSAGSHSGGGASDIRLINDLWSNALTLNSRIMVAAGGGGAGIGGYNSGGDSSSAGGLIGYSGGYYAGHGNGNQYGKGGTQLHAGAGGSSWAYGSAAPAGTFGIGGFTTISSSNAGAGGGGGGYYGGGSGSNTTQDGAGNGAGGGSSYISGHTGCVAIAEGTNNEPRTTRLDSNNVLCSSSSSTGYNALGYNIDQVCSEHYSDKVFTDTLMIDGSGIKWEVVDGVLHNTEQVAMPNPLGGEYTLGEGHVGNGYARITYIPQ